MSTRHFEPAKFSPGDRVTIRTSGHVGTVVAYVPGDEGQWRVIVDQPHGQGVMRKTFPEEELKA